MPGSVQEYIDSPSARGELIDFLRRTGDLPPGTCSWERRLAHWWDENPHREAHPLRGYVVRSSDRIVGFGGAVPCRYTLGLQTLPAVIATTLRVDKGHERAGLKMLLKLRKFGSQHLFVLSTPIPRLQHVLDDMGARPETLLVRHLSLMGWPARWMCSAAKWPPLSSGMRIVTSLQEVQGLVQKLPQYRIEPLVTLESLRWHLSTPLHRMKFLGAVDEGGRLHSCLILQRHRTLRLFHAWEVVFAWTARDHPLEIQALAGALVRAPSLLGENGRWFTATTFAGDDTWQGLPWLLSRQETVCHYFLMPADLQGAPKLTRMAEGDIVL